MNVLAQSALVLTIASATPTAFADTIVQVHRTGGEAIFARDVVVVGERRSPGVRWVRYYYWDADSSILRNVELPIYDADSNLQYRVTLSPPDERQRLINSILGAGTRARVTDRKETVSEVFCVRVTYRLPRYANSDSGTDIYLAKSDSANVERIPFSGIRSMVLIANDWHVTMRSGVTIVGRLWGRTIQGIPFEPEALEGLTKAGNLINISVEAVSRIDFIN